MGMLCNKDADVENLCVSVNVVCHRIKGGTEKESGGEEVLEKLNIGCVNIEMLSQN